VKPLGKGMKIAHHLNQDQTLALNQTLSAYRSTPHPSTGYLPGSLMFTNDYNHDLPHVGSHHPQLEEAYNNDVNTRNKRQNLMNSSKHRSNQSIMKGDLVIARKMKRKKFDPYYNTTQYIVLG